MAKALHSEQPPTPVTARGNPTLKIHLSPGEMQVYIRFLKRSHKRQHVEKPFADRLADHKKAEKQLEEAKLARKRH